MRNALSIEEAATGSIDWHARCGHCLYVGEFEAVVLSDLGAAQVLVLDAGILFAIPADIGRETWCRLSRGDLICVRWDTHDMDHLPVVLSVDAMDGRTSVASKLLINLNRCETRNRHVSRPRTRTDWRMYAQAEAFADGSVLQHGVPNRSHLRRRQNSHCHGNYVC